MRTARTKKGKPVQADSAKRRRKHYCPKCKKRVIRSKGAEGDYRFVHKKKRFCQWFGSHKKESEWHWETKRDIFNEISRRPNEFYKHEAEAQVGRRKADLLIPSRDGNTYVIEIQKPGMRLHSRKGKSGFRDRIRFHMNHGYLPVTIHPASGGRRKALEQWAHCMFDHDGRSGPSWRYCNRTGLLVQNEDDKWIAGSLRGFKLYPKKQHVARIRGRSYPTGIAGAIRIVRQRYEIPKDHYDARREFWSNEPHRLKKISKWRSP